MKTKSPAGVKGIEGTATAVEPVSTPILIDEAESRGTLFRIQLDLHGYAKALGIEPKNLTPAVLVLLRNGARLALRTLCHRNPKGRASLYPIGKDDVLPAVADVKDIDFIAAIRDVTFQGDTTPNDRDKADAKAIVTHCGDSTELKEKMIATILAKYGVEVVITMDSLSSLFMEVRLEKERAEKAASAAKLRELIQG